MDDAASPSPTLPDSPPTVALESVDSAAPTAASTASAGGHALADAHTNLPTDTAGDATTGPVVALHAAGRHLANSGDQTFNGMRLVEAVADDGSGRTIYIAFPLFVCLIRYNQKYLQRRKIGNRMGINRKTNDK